ncbi:MAG: DUF3857 domain-containing protein [Flavobacterium sp.]|nr:MAG: DUF3857 domain-containing protein [Flavobacterium sp.]
MNRLLKNALVLTALLCTPLLFAQEFSFKNYDWETKPGAPSIPAQYKDENEVILERNQKVEYAVSGNSVNQYTLLHEKTYINSDDAIERNNRVYLPFALNESVLTNKVRVILKSGKVITLDKKDIKEETDEERGIKYNYFAVTGLEKGAVIEKIFVLSEMPELKGQTIKMQDEYPIAKLNFELIYPEHLVFKYKTYNGLAEPVLDTAKVKEKVVLSVNEKDIPGLDNDEKYSNWNLKLKMLRFKLDANLANRGRNLYNFKEFATNIHERLNPELDKREQKAIDEFCKTIPKSTDPQDQIWQIENKIKKTIIFNKFIDSKEKLSDVIKTKQANEVDILKLYLAVFHNFKIENNVVLTSNRYKIPFDTEFESYENLNELLFYFPSVKKFLTPTEVEYRIPLIPATVANNNGLFVKEKSFAGVNMGIGEVGFIDIPGTDITHDVMVITVDFTKDIENPLVTTKINFGGYSALNFQPIKDFASADQYKNVLKSIAENYTVDTEYKTLKTENDGTEFIGKKPFVLEVTYDGKDLIQKAGDNYLFSVGQTIGKQMELYQENKRTMPIEIDYPHSYARKITIILPKGATVQNLDKINLDYKTDLNGNTEAMWKSGYTKTGDEVVINNTEYYKVVNYPLEKFEDYRAVINAAADFNKIVLIVKK